MTEPTTPRETKSPTPDLPEPRLGYGLRRRKGKRQAGMTLIEITVVVVIMAMIAAAVGVAVFPQFAKAKLKQAKTDTKTIQSAVEIYFVNGGENCPSIEELVQSSALKKGSNTKDPWGLDYQIHCEGEDVTVTSAGPDKQFGSEDDI